MERNDLFDFMYAASQEMTQEYQRIQKRAKIDSGNAGAQGEENWATLFRDWLSPNFHVVTGGRILSHDGKTSPQVDVIILRPEYPRKLLDKKLFLAGGVIAAFECKVTLRVEHIEKVIKNCIFIKNMCRKRYGTIYKELNSPIIFGLLAHSHNIKLKKTSPIEKITKTLDECDGSLIKHPIEMLDILCVSDVATWVSEKKSFMLPKGADNIDASNIPDNLKLMLFISLNNFLSYYSCRSAKLSQQCKNFTAIGSLLAVLYDKIAWEIPELRQLADYYWDTRLQGVGGGVARHWGLDIFTEEVQKRIISRDFTVMSRWDEWSTQPIT